MTNSSFSGNRNVRGDSRIWNWAKPLVMACALGGALVGAATSRAFAEDPNPYDNFEPDLSPEERLKAIQDELKAFEQHRAFREKQNQKLRTFRPESDARDADILQRETEAMDSLRQQEARLRGSMNPNTKRPTAKTPLPQNPPPAASSSGNGNDAGAPPPKNTRSLDKPTGSGSTGSDAPPLKNTRALDRPGAPPSSEGAKPGGTPANPRTYDAPSSDPDARQDYFNRKVREALGTKSTSPAPAQGEGFPAGSPRIGGSAPGQSSGGSRVMRPSTQPVEGGGKGPLGAPGNGEAFPPSRQRGRNVAEGQDNNSGATARSGEESTYRPDDIPGQRRTPPQDPESSAVPRSGNVGTQRQEKIADPLSPPVESPSGTREIDTRSVRPVGDPNRPRPEGAGPAGAEFNRPAKGGFSRTPPKPGLNLPSDSEPTLGGKDGVKRSDLRTPNSGQATNTNSGQGAGTPRSNTGAPSNTSGTASSQKGGNSDELPRLDPNDPRNLPKIENGRVTATQQGGSASAEEIARREFVMKKDGTVVPGKENPVDGIGRRETMVQVNPDTGKRTFIHGPDVPPGEKKRIEAAMNRNLDSKINQAITDRKDQIKRIEAQNEAERARIARNQSEPGTPTGNGESPSPRTGQTPAEGPGRPPTEVTGVDGTSGDTPVRGPASDGPAGGPNGPKTGAKTAEGSGGKPPVSEGTGADVAGSSKPTEGKGEGAMLAGGLLTAAVDSLASAIEDVDAGKEKGGLELGLAAAGDTLEGGLLFTMKTGAGALVGGAAGFVLSLGNPAGALAGAKLGAGITAGWQLGDGAIAAGSRLGEAKAKHDALEEQRERNSPDNLGPGSDALGGPLKGSANADLSPVNGAPQGDLDRVKSELLKQFPDLAKASPEEQDEIARRVAGLTNKERAEANLPTDEPLSVRRPPDAPPETITEVRPPVDLPPREPPVKTDGANGSIDDFGTDPQPPPAGEKRPEDFGLTGGPLDVRQFTTTQQQQQAAAIAAPVQPNLQEADRLDRELTRQQQDLERQIAERRAELESERKAQQDALDDYRRKWDEYNRKLDQYKDSQQQRDAYDKQMAAWNDFQRKLEDYKRRVETWNDYRRRLADYNNRVAQFRDYQERLADYNRRLAEWRVYQERAAAFERAQQQQAWQNQQNPPRWPTGGGSSGGGGSMPAQKSTAIIRDAP